MTQEVEAVVMAEPVSLCRLLVAVFTMVVAVADVTVAVDPQVAMAALVAVAQVVAVLAAALKMERPIPEAVAVVMRTVALVAMVAQVL